MFLFFLCQDNPSIFFISNSHDIKHQIMWSALYETLRVCSWNCFLVCSKSTLYWLYTDVMMWVSMEQANNKGRHITQQSESSKVSIWYYIGWRDLVFLYWFLMPRITRRSYMYLLLCCSVSDLWQKNQLLIAGSDFSCSLESFSAHKCIPTC